MHFDFMTPDIWDGLVAGSVLIGLSLATLRIMQDRRATNAGSRALARSVTNVINSDRRTQLYSPLRGDTHHARHHAHS